MKRFIISCLVFVLLILGKASHGGFEEDKVVVYKGKHEPTFDGENLCNGSGSKCLELTAEELSGIIKFIKKVLK